ncbi:unnamed protein product [Amoebophrya sp. A120]|nr:unnamed protein product [Amoebophrya sp. A120]|eukprot:GSA120T00011993001.1
MLFENRKTESPRPRPTTPGHHHELEGHSQETCFPDVLGWRRALLIDGIMYFLLAVEKNEPEALVLLLSHLDCMQVTATRVFHLLQRCSGREISNSKQGFVRSFLWQHHRVLFQLNRHRAAQAVVHAAWLDVREQEKQNETVESLMGGGSGPATTSTEITTSSTSTSVLLESVLRSLYSSDQKAFWTLVKKSHHDEQLQSATTTSSCFSTTGGLRSLLSDAELFAVYSQADPLRCFFVLNLWRRTKLRSRKTTAENLKAAFSFILLDGTSNSLPAHDRGGTQDIYTLVATWCSFAGASGSSASTSGLRQQLRDRLGETDQDVVASLVQENHFATLDSPDGDAEGTGVTTGASSIASGAPGGGAPRPTTGGITRTSSALAGSSTTPRSWSTSASGLLASEINFHVKNCFLEGNADDLKQLFQLVLEKTGDVEHLCQCLLQLHTKSAASWAGAAAGETSAGTSEGAGAVLGASTLSNGDVELSSSTQEQQDMVDHFCEEGAIMTAVTTSCATSVLERTTRPLEEQLIKFAMCHLDHYPEIYRCLSPLPHFRTLLRKELSALLKVLPVNKVEAVLSRDIVDDPRAPGGSPALTNQGKMGGNKELFVVKKANDDQPQPFSIKKTPPEARPDTSSSSPKTTSREAGQLHDKVDEIPRKKESSFLRSQLLDFCSELEAARKTAEVERRKAEDQRALYRQAFLKQVLVVQGGQGGGRQGVVFDPTAVRMKLMEEAEMLTSSSETAGMKTAPAQEHRGNGKDSDQVQTLKIPFCTVPLL